MAHEVRGHHRRGVEPLYMPAAQTQESLCQKITRIFCRCCFNAERIAKEQIMIAVGFRQTHVGHLVLDPIPRATSTLTGTLHPDVSLETLSSEGKETASSTEIEASESNPALPLSPVSITDEEMGFQFHESASTLDLLKDEASA